MIAKEVVEEIIMRTDIESLISGYVNLKRAGSVSKGLCPFHSEKSPSFMVYPATSSFYCFGCGKGGDAVTFIKEIEHLDYPDALEVLAKRAGITIIRDDKSIPAGKSVDRARMFKMNADAANFFHKALYSTLPGAKDALTYFTEKRKLSQSTIKHFGLGYAPDSFDALMKHMLSLGYKYDELVEGFLCGRSESGKYYDAFRKRAMFPIIDVAGNVIAFGGRAIDAETKQKYKNSSDTPVFKKSRNLFALNFARHACAETMILCEGYMDVIALHAAGFTNAVATLGTAITAEQARLMSRYTKRVVICYDSDEPGQIAANKAMRIISDVGLEVRLLVLEGAKDPDEYIKNFGADKFRSILEGAKIPFEYKLDNILAKYDVTIPKDQIKAVGEVENLISAFYSEAERDIYIRIAADKLKIAAVGIKNDVEKIRAKNERTEKKDESRHIIQSTAGYSDKVNPDYAKAPAIAKTEEIIIGLLMLFPEHRKYVFENAALTADDFFTAFNRRIFEYIEEKYRDNDKLVDLNERFNADEVGRITKMKLSRMSLDTNDADVLKESINSLKSSMQKRSGAGASTADDLLRYINSIRDSK